MGLLNINTLGTTFSIKAAQDEKYLNKLLDYYNQITDALKKQNNLKDSKQVAILAGILICDELYKEKQKSFELQQSLSKNNFTNSTQNNNDDLFQQQTQDDILNLDKFEKITNDIISKIEEVL